jgi:hypothetical protein
MTEPGDNDYEELRMEGCPLVPFKPLSPAEDSSDDGNPRIKKVHRIAIHVISKFSRTRSSTFRSRAVIRPALPSPLVTL